MPAPSSAAIHRKIRLTTAFLLLIWAIVSFGWIFFARELDFKIFDWNFNFWMAAQGSVLVFLLLTVVNAWLINRWEKQLESDAAVDATPKA